MTNYRSLDHSKLACQYHVVFIPKYRKRAICVGAAPVSVGSAAAFGQAARE